MVDGGSVGNNSRPFGEPFQYCCGVPRAGISLNKYINSIYDVRACERASVRARHQGIRQRLDHIMAIVESTMLMPAFHFSLFGIIVRNIPGPGVCMATAIGTGVRIVEQMWCAPLILVNSIQFK